MDHAEEQAQELEALEAILMDDLQGDLSRRRRMHGAYAALNIPPPARGSGAPPHFSMSCIHLPCMLVQSSTGRGRTVGTRRAPATASSSPRRTTAPPAQTRTSSLVWGIATFSRSLTGFSSRIPACDLNDVNTDCRPLRGCAARMRWPCVFVAAPSFASLVGCL